MGLLECPHSWSRLTTAGSDVHGWQAGGFIMTTTLTPTVEDRLDALSAQVEFLVQDAQRREVFNESLTALTSDVSPIARQGFESISRVLGDLESRGYADFARSGAGVVDRIVTSFTREDIELLGDNVVLILQTVKEMTQPEVMRMLQTTFHNVADVETVQEPPSLFGLLRQMRDPDVRRGLARLISVLQTMGESSSRDLEMRKEQPE
jgi:uncharacterized protein YjgD (DUF1641 family)